MTAAGDDIIIEVRVHGQGQRVSAIDVQTLIEVVFQAPVTADRASIERLARQKLAWRLGRAADASGRDALKPPDGRGGTLA